MTGRECTKCKAQIGRSNKSGFCQSCYLKRNDDSEDSSNVNKEVSPVNNIDCGLGLDSDTLNNLPELPTAWHEKDLQDLNAGHLVRILMCFFQPVQQELEAIRIKVKDMGEKIDIVSAKCESNSDKIKENESNLLEKGNELTLMKKAILNQQTFLENLQKKDLRNNVIVTGIPNSNLEIDGDVLQSDEEKITGILYEIDEELDSNSYEIVSFPHVENRNTHVCKLIFKDFDLKKKILSNSKILKDKDSLSKIYLQWDEPKLTRQENHRLRKKRWTLKQDHPGHTFELKNGVLKQNGRQVDKFNLVNQIF